MFSIKICVQVLQELFALLGVCTALELCTAAPAAANSVAAVPVSVATDTAVPAAAVPAAVVAAIADLAQNHQRTEGAIRSRLMKLGKLQPPGGGV